MAIAFSNLGDSADPDFNDNTNLSAYLTASWSPPSSGLIVLFVYGRRATAGHSPPSGITGNNLTWTLITNIGSGRFNFSLWGANASGSTTGQTTITFANEQTACSAAFFQATGVDLSGGVAAAFVQNPTNTGTDTSGSITLNAAGNAANRSISGWGLQITDEAMTHRTNWTEQDEIVDANPGRMETQSRTDAFETTASCSWTSSVLWYGIAAELKSAEAAGGITVDTGNITVATPVANAASPQQFNHTCGANVKLLVVPITIYDTSPTDGVVSAVTYNGDPLASATLYYDSLCDGHVSIWWMALPDTGSSYIVEVTFGGIVTDFEAAAIGVNGTVGSFAKDSNGTPATGTTGDLVITWDTVAEDTIVFAAALDDQTDAGKVTPQEIEIYTVDVGDVVSAEYAIRSASGSQTLTIADADGDEDWVIVGAGFYEIAVSGEYFQSADGVLTPVGTIIKSGGKVLAGVLTPVGIISKETSKTFTGSSTLVGTIIKQAQKLLTGTTTPVGTLITSFLQSISIAGSLTPAGTVIKQAGKNIAGILTASGVLIKSTSKSLIGSLTATGTLIKQTGKILLGSITPSGVVSTTKVTLLAISGVVTASGTLIRRTSKSFVGSVTAVGTLLRATARSLIATGSMTLSGVLTTAKTVFESITGLLTPSGSLIKQAGKVLLGSLTPSGILATAKTLVISLAGVLTPSGGLIRQIGKIVAGSLTLTGSLVKRTAKSIIGSITAVGTLATQKISGGYFQAIDGVLTMSGIVTKQAGKIFSGSLTTAGSLVNRAGKVLSGQLTPSGILAAAKATLLSISGSLTPSGILIRQTGKIILGSLTASGALIKKTSKNFVGSLTPAGTLIKQTAKAFIGAITAVGSLATQKMAGGYFQVVGGFVNMTGALSRQTTKTFSGAVSATGSLSKRTIKSFIGSVTTTGSLVTQKSFYRVIAGALTMSGALIKRTSIQITGIITMAGSITKRISIKVSGVLTAIGVLARQLLGLPTPYDQTFAIPSENRIYSIAAENRIYSVPG